MTMTLHATTPTLDATLVIETLADEEAKWSQTRREFRKATA